MDHEEIVLRNPALGARAFWHFSYAYSVRGKGAPPELPHFLLAAGMLYHRSSVQKIKGMNFDSGLLKAVSDRPDIVAGLQYRMESYARETFVALQVGTASGLLLREGGSEFPAFRALGMDLPLSLRDGSGHVNEIFLAAKRLGAWFGNETLEAIQRRLIVEF
jgi:hypothetical protein